MPFEFGGKLRGRAAAGLLLLSRCHKVADVQREGQLVEELAAKEWLAHLIAA
jgi:hypothetical protein